MNDSDRLRGFERRLLHELTAYVSESTRGVTTTDEGLAMRPRFGRVAKLSLVGGLGAAALSVGAIVAEPELTASPAYAVESNDDGTLTVEITSPEDAAGLEQKLADHGIVAKVDFPPVGHVCDPHRYTPAGRLDRQVRPVIQDSGEEGRELTFQFTVNPKDFSSESGHTLVIDATKGFFAAVGSATWKSAWEDAGLLPHASDSGSHEGVKVVSGAFGVGAAKGKVGECNPQLIKQ